MAVTLRAATDDARGTTNPAQPTLPAGVVDGDLLIAIQTSDLNGSLASMTAPAGWVERGSSSRTDVGFIKVWTKVAASEPATYSFPDSTSAHGSAIVIAVTGQDATAPLAVTPTFASGAAATAHPAPSVAGVADGLLITAHLAGTAGTTRDYTAPTGMTTAQKSSLTTAANILTGAYYLALGASGQTGAKSATCTASTPYVTMSLVVAPVVAVVTATPATAFGGGSAANAAARSNSTASAGRGSATGAANSPTVAATSASTATAGRGSATGKANNATVVTSSSTSTTVTAGATASGTAYGSNTGAVFGFTVVSSVDPGSGGLFPSESLFPSDGLFPSAGVTTTAQTVSPPGIPSGESVGSPAISVANGPQDVVATSIGSSEAFGVPTVAPDVGPQDITAVGGIDTVEALGRPAVTVAVGAPPLPVPGAQYLDTYFVDGIDLAGFTTQIEVAEGLADTPGTVGEDVAIPGRDGLLEVWGGPGQQRRPDGPGKWVASMWLIGVDPVTGNLLDPADSAAAYQDRWDELVRMFHRRRIVIDHPRPSGTRRAVGYLTPGESMAPDSRSASPWFGRFKATVTIPAGHWTDQTSVTTGPTLLANNGVLSLSAWAAATAPCTELTITFGPGNNPRLSTSVGFVGWNGTIAPGRQLTIDTATGELGYGAGQVWTPSYDGLIYSPGPRLFEIDPSEPLSAVLTHTGGGSMSVEVAGPRRYRTS